MSSPKSWVVVGAGLSGLTMAELIRSRSGESPLLLEKSKSVGGRMATRRGPASAFDHGSQFFKDSPESRFLWTERWQQAGCSRLWFERGPVNYHCGLSGMTALAKNLAQKLDWVPDEKVIRIESSNQELGIFCESGRAFQAERIVLSCPLPQSLQILRDSGISFPDGLDQIVYAKALVGLFEVENVDLPGGILDLNDFPVEIGISSIANNASKGISSVPALTVVMSPQFSETHFENPEMQTLEMIREALQTVLPGVLRVSFQQLKKWRYAHPLGTFQESHLQLSSEPRVFLIGDAFGGPSLAGAVRSALSLVKKLGF
jgi:renalase